ncbi:hypothetical protein BD560DRAFT_414768 [Blakeslea trispora]|nr:hypothetical protein BD560DRAFT_414768 [Blakeslea trispora]
MKNECNLSLKSITRHPVQRNSTKTLEARAAWVAEWIAEGIDYHNNCIFVDESGSNVNMTRGRAWSKKGEPAIEETPSTKAVSKTALGAVSSAGIVNKNEGCSSKGDLEEKDEESDHSKKDDAEPSVWLDWINYLESRASLFHPYSPEANNIIRSGKGISPRPHLDRDIYERHIIKKITEEGLIPKIYQIFIDQYIDSDDLASGKKVIRSLSKKIALTEDEDEISEFEFLEKLL